jgi:hypothetical protein
MTSVHRKLLKWSLETDVPGWVHGKIGNQYITGETSNVLCLVRLSPCVIIGGAIMSSLSFVYSCTEM